MTENNNRVCCLYRVSTDKQVDFTSNHEADLPMQRKACHKFAEGKTQEVVDAMDAYIQNQQQTMEHYLEDQYQIAASAKVATVPTGEVVMVCCENSDAVMNAIKTALAA